MSKKKRRMTSDLRRTRLQRLQAAGERVFLPETLRGYFDSCEFDTLNWRDHTNSIIHHVLYHGGWEDWRWLRQRVSKRGLAKWIVENDGSDLTKHQLRFFQMVFRIPARVVDPWIADPNRKKRLPCPPYLPEDYFKKPWSDEVPVR